MPWYVCPEKGAPAGTSPEWREKQARKIAANEAAKTAADAAWLAVDIQTLIRAKYELARKEHERLEAVKLGISAPIASCV